MAEAAGGFEARIPGSGARGGVGGAWDAGAWAAFGRGGAGVVTGCTMFCRGAGAVVAGCAWTRGTGGMDAARSVVDCPTPDCSSGPLRSGGGGFTLAPRFPMLGFTIPHPTAQTMMTPRAERNFVPPCGREPVALITLHGWEGATLHGWRCKLSLLADLNSCRAM